MGKGLENFKVEKWKCILKCVYVIWKCDIILYVIEWIINDFWLSNFILFIVDGNLWKSLWYCYVDWDD